MSLALTCLSYARTLSSVELSRMCDQSDSGLLRKMADETETQENRNFNMNMTNRGKFAALMPNSVERLNEQKESQLHTHMFMALKGATLEKAG